MSISVCFSLCHPSPLPSLPQLFLFLLSLPPLLYCGHYFAEDKSIIAVVADHCIFPHLPYTPPHHAHSHSFIEWISTARICMPLSSMIPPLSLCLFSYLGSIFPCSCCFLAELSISVYHLSRLLFMSAL